MDFIKIEGVSKSYHGIKAVDDFSLSIPEGQVFGLLGPNGAGKTTLIKMLVGLLNPEEGRILIKNQSKEKNYLEYKQHYGYVPEEISLYDKLTGREFLNLIGNVRGMSRSLMEERSEKYLSLFEMEAKVEDYICNYSHGMKQKLMIIAAVLDEPDILILDEPFVGLDAVAFIRFKELIRTYPASGRLVLISTHLLDIAQKLCDSYGIIRDGRLLRQGRMAEEDEELENLFLKLVDNGVKEE